MKTKEKTEKYSREYIKEFVSVYCYCNETQNAFYYTTPQERLNVYLRYFDKHNKEHVKTLRETYYWENENEKWESMKPKIEAILTERLYIELNKKPERQYYVLDWSMYKDEQGKRHTFDDIITIEDYYARHINATNIILIH